MLQTLAIFERTGDGVLAVDGNQRVVFWNEAAKELLGYAAADVLDRRCWQVMAGRDSLDRLVCGPGCQPLAHCGQEQPVASRDLVAVNAHGLDVVINVSTVCIACDDGRGSVGQYLVHLFRLVEQAPALSSGLRVCLLGTTAVAKDDGAAVESRFWNRAKVRALLGYLALHPRQHLSQEVLVQNLWPELPPKSAHHNLATTVFYLRRCLEPELSRGRDSSYIHFENGHYLFDGGRSYWVDVWAFEAEVACARRAQRPEEAVAAYQRALSYYGGNFQRSLAAGNWFWHRNQRTRLRTLYYDVLEELAVLHEGLGQEIAAMNLLERLLELQPWHERAGRRLMGMLLARGAPLEALDLYQRLVAALQTELGLSSDDETKRLVERIRRVAELP